ncbi:MAG: cob(I)yrinic acid a,c-diamide adenosyltransferase [Flavobacteriaceae bacterium]|nr:cob(I)yrinic acid a,c-diamide adenosyltransferase [Flavobacteriaceae bacterium]
MKIYTKTGDQGMTSLFNGKRVPKHHQRIEAYGTLDELNAYLGLLRDQNIAHEYKEFLVTTQKNLFVVGAQLANPKSQETDQTRKTPKIQPQDIAALETSIDQMNTDLPPMTHFILPGGHTTVSYCHLARTVSRRGERLATLLNDMEPIDPLVIQYLNRLSDYLFVLARKLTQDLEAEEIKWLPEVE